MNLWRKRVTTEWLDRHETALQEWTDGALTVIQRSGHDWIQLEVPCLSPRLEQNLVREFGGGIRHVPRGWRAQMAKAARTKPLKIGKHLVIVGSRKAGRAFRRRERILVIPAGAAFGTGEHATTAMSLRFMEKVSRGMAPAWTMLDVGTGTGILALAGRCLGAGRVIAADNDPNAISTAKQNARLNGIRRVRFELAEAAKLNGKEKFDLITANLFSELLVAALPIWKTRLKTSGRMILSGVLRKQENQLLRALRANNFCNLKVKRCGKWVAILAKR